MIERYEDKKIKKLWSDQNKFNEWFKAEMAVVQARVNFREIPPIILSRIEARAKFTVERVKEIESKTHHDLASFVQAVQESLDPDLRGFIHSGGVTSYDIEEPAMARIIISSIEHVHDIINMFLDTLKRKAVKYKNLIVIGRTHGQHAEPISLGIRFLNYLDAVERASLKLEDAKLEMYSSKISGAVGVYGHGLTPELEQEALSILGLKRARIATQIIPRDRIANVLSAIAILGATLENIALDFRLSGLSEIHELQEPFSKGQKGSSVMPHKKNTINTEKVSGLSRLLRSYLTAALENIPTWFERDISHSSVERVILPDSFHTISHMIAVLDEVIEDMVVNEQDIERNLTSTMGTAITPEVKDLMIQYGTDPEIAYSVCQELAFQAQKTKECFLDLLEKDIRVPKEIKVEGLLDNLYEKRYHQVEYVNEIFARFGI